MGPLSARRLADPTNRRRVLVMADQAASSLSNTLVGIFAARALSAVVAHPDDMEFGAAAAVRSWS